VNDRDAGFLVQPSGKKSRPMNALFDVLRTLRLSGGIFLDCEFSAPWCVTASAIGQNEVGLLMMPFPAHVIAYHYITHGRLLQATPAFCRPKTAELTRHHRPNRV
jgi:hypothetical protein